MYEGVHTPICGKIEQYVENALFRLKHPPHAEGVLLKYDYIISQ